MELIQPHGFFVFRRPLLPVDDVFDFLAHTAAGDGLEEKLRLFFFQPSLQEGIYLASPPLYDLLQAWLRGEPVSRKEKLLKTLLKYLLRAGVRCTPYGMFAGCTTVGYVAPQTVYTAREENSLSKRSRLDADYAARLVSFFVSQPLVRQALAYYPNDSLYQAGDRYHYTYYQTRQGSRHYSICSVAASPWLARALEEAQGGATIRQLARALTVGDIAGEEAESFIDHLIDEQLLVSELQPSVTGDDFLETLIRHLAPLDQTAPFMPGLREIHRLLNRECPGTDDYLRVKKTIGRHFFPADEGNVVQTDLFFNAAANTIGARAVHSLRHTFEKLLVLDQGVYNPDLEAFKERFYARFGDREVPLPEALDSELGVGYGAANLGLAGYSPLVEDLGLAAEPAKPVVEWNYWKDFVLRKYSEALLRQADEIVLTDEDLKALQQHHRPARPDMPASFAAFGNLIAESAEAVDRGDFTFHLHSIAGPSGVNMLSRFCHGDEELLRNVRQCIRAEEENAPDAIFAEVVHLPEDRTGNVLMRPALYQYEIPYLAKASVAEEYRIPLDDLLVSVRHGREIVLRSRRHNKRVFIRLTSMHNYSRGLSIYKFLCDLQFASRTLQVCWHWSILEKQAFLPRVRYRNVTLSRATWTLDAGKYPELRAKNTDAIAFLRQLRAEWRIPQYVLIAEKDNELLIDFQNNHCLELLKEELLRKELVTLKEVLQTPGKCFLRDAKGSYKNEVIIPFRSAVRPAAPEVALPAGNVQRKFAPGSEWLYVKIYTGEKFADTLLKGCIGRLAEGLHQAGIIDQWFFVRYTDPDHHLRLRFHGRPENGFYSEVLGRLNAVLDKHLRSGLVHKIQTDTYTRELERYGSETMQLSEALFCNDSLMVTRFLRLLREESREKLRWLFALAATDALLDDFHYSLEEKYRLIAELQGRFFAEFGGQDDLKKQLNDKFRHDREDIARFLARDADAFPEAARAYRLLKKRSGRNRALAGAVRAQVAGENGRLDGLLSSYLHMSLNRLFISDQRLHELVVYHYLERYYKTTAGKRRAALCAG